MKRSRENYLYYTGIFIVLACLLYGIFILTGKSFIWEGDGLAQHYPVLEKFYTPSTPAAASKFATYKKIPVSPSTSFHSF